MLILTFEDSEEEILNHIISCVNTGARVFQVIENAKTNLSYGDIVILLDKREYVSYTHLTLPTIQSV